MKFLTLTLLVILYVSAAYKVRKEPFTPSVGILAPSNGEDSLTDNYLEMVNQPSKKLISMGIHDVDVDKNIVIGDRYEDVVYQKEEKKSAKGKKSVKLSQRFAKKQDDEEEEEESADHSEEERSLDQLLDVEFKNPTNSAEDAFDAVMRHQDQILAFLDEIAQEREPSGHQQLVVKQLFKYLKVVQGAHDLHSLNAKPEDEEFLKQIEASIHKYTIGLDELKYNESRHYSTQKRYIGKTQADNALLLDELQDKVDRIVYFLDDEEQGEYDQIIATEQASRAAQIAVKILQTRALIDKVKWAHVELNPAPQYELLQHYQTVLKEEKLEIAKDQVELERLSKLFTENDELTEDQIQSLADNEILPEKARKAARTALYNLEQEDEYQAEVALELIDSTIKEMINDYIHTDAKLAQQTIKMVALHDAITDGDMNGFEEICKEIVNEVAEDQEVFVGNKDVAEISEHIENALRKHNYKMVPTLAQKLVEFVKTKDFAQPSHAKLDNSIDENGKAANKQAAEVAVLSKLTKAAKDLTAAEDRQQAEDFIEQVASLTQQMNKITKFRIAIQKAIGHDDNADKLNDALFGLQQLLESEHDNLVTDRDQMTTSQENVEKLAKSSLTEEWQDSHVKALTIVEEDNLNALARWAVLTAAQYIQLEVNYEVKTFLNQALAFIGNDIRSLEKSIESVEDQQKHFSDAQQAAEQGDADGVVEALEALIVEIQTEQPVVEVDVEVEADAENAMTLLADGKTDEAVKAVNKISLTIVDPRGENQEDIFEKLENQEYANGLDPVSGLDINETNKSPATIEVENIQKEIEVFRADVEDKCEVEDKLAAEASWEAFFNYAQRAYKQIDFETTENAIKNAQEVGAGASAYEKFLEDFSASNEEESAALTEKANALLGFKEDVEAIQSGFEEWSNTEVMVELRTLFNQEQANSAVKTQINLALDFANSDKRASALETIETIVEKVQEQIDAAQASIDSIEVQNGLIENALAAAAEADFDEVLSKMANLIDAIREGQSVILTDARCNELLVQAQDNLREGAFGDALNAANEIAENLTNEVNANREAQVADPIASPSEEQQANDAAELERDVENAQDMIHEGTELEALQAIEHVEQQVQKDAKVKLVEEIKQAVAGAFEGEDAATAVGATESLVEILLVEREQLEGAHDEIDAFAEQVAEATEAEDQTPEDVQATAEGLLNEANDVDAVPASVQKALEEAEEEATEGNLKDASEALETASNEARQEEEALAKAVEVIDGQISNLKKATRAAESEDAAAALVQFTNSANSIYSQPRKSISDDAHEKAEEAKQAVAEGDKDTAARLVEEIVQAAEEEIESDLSDAEVESVEESEDDEDKGKDCDASEEEKVVLDRDLVALVQGVVKALTPEDPAELNQEDCLTATQALKDYEGAAQFEIQIAQMEISIKSDDYDGAAAQAEALLVFLDPAQDASEEENDGITKKLLPSLEKRFSKIHTKAMKKAEKKLASKQRSNKRMLASIKKYSIKE